MAVLAVGAVLNLVISWQARARLSPPLWGIPALSGMSTGVVGMLAGFTVAAAIFLASLGLGNGSAAFEAVVGTLMICSLILIATAMMYATTLSFPPSAADSGETLQSPANVVTSGVYFLGVSVGVFAPPLLLNLIGLTTVGQSLGWPLFAVAVYERARLGLVAFRLTLARSRACLALPLLGTGLAAVYWFVATRLWPVLRPVARPLCALAISPSRSPWPGLSSRAGSCWSTAIRRRTIGLPGAAIASASPICKSSRSPCC